MILTGRVDSEAAALRLDDAARQLFPSLSKSDIRRIIDLGGCAVNQVMVRIASKQLRAGDEITIGVMEPERYLEVTCEKSDLLFENSEFLALNKAAGINSQRTPYQFKGTVEYAVGQYLRSLGSSEPARVIHRLDRGTSGVMFFPKTKPAATWVSDRLKNSLVEKVYWAIVADIPDQVFWQVNAPIGKLNKFRYGVTLPGKPAVTDFRILATGSGAALIEARPHTGRTHQIRVHLAHSGLPIIGDTPYGGAPAERMMLHCRRMAFTDRREQLISATAEPDQKFNRLLTENRLIIPAAEDSRP
jgi:RluA family pseudouridine synthase